MKVSEIQLFLMHVTILLMLLLALMFIAKCVRIATTKKITSVGDAVIVLIFCALIAVPKIIVMVIKKHFNNKFKKA